MFQAIENKVIVEVTQKYIGNISNILKIASIENNSSVDPVELVNIVGKVVSLPTTVTDRLGYEGFSTDVMKVGDTIIFSYQVIYDIVQKEEDAEPDFKNIIRVNGKEYFSADITQIFGIVYPDGIKMINGYVMATPFVEKKIIISAKSKQVKGTTFSHVMHIGSPRKNMVGIDVSQGDTIKYNPMIAQKYQINNKPFVILQQHHILGKDLED
jgi:co-chaperonin GroES (HSP10)